MMEINLIEKNKQIFEKYNNTKINFFYQIAEESQIAAFKIIPYLFQFNHISFPGYQKNCEEYCGIFNFKSNETDFKYLKKFFPNFKLPSFIKQKNIIENLSIMGSIGTIAQTTDSDFDIWLVINEKILSAENIIYIKNKCSAIEEWMSNKLNVEVHFFIMDNEKLVKNDFGVTDEESCGSAQGLLLKDEFFRNSILLAGKIPLWWLIPLKCNSEEYYEVKEELDKKFPEKSRFYIDFGFLYEINDSEFLGAGLWQIVKSFKNPFKSLLKLGLLEEYLYSNNSSALSCELLKSNLFNDKFENKFIDGYRLIFDKILEFYQKNKTEKEIFLLQAAFFLKTCIKRKKKEKSNIKHDIIMEYLDEWEWQEDIIQYLENFRHWSVEQINNLGNIFNKEILKTYDRIISFKTKHKSKLSENDRITIERKIKVKTEKLDNKIMTLPISFRNNLFEKKLTFYFNEKNCLWELYRDNFQSTGIFANFNTIIFSSKNIIEILAWISINKLYKHKFTQISIVALKKNIKLNSIVNTLNKLYQQFHKSLYSKIPHKNFLCNKTVYRNWIYFNFENYEEDDKKYADLIFQNNWGEIFYKKIEYSENLKEIISFVYSTSYIKQIPYNDFIDLNFEAGKLIINSKLKNEFFNIFNVLAKKNKYVNQSNIFIKKDYNSFSIFELDSNFTIKYSNLKTFNDIIFYTQKIRKKYIEISSNFLETDELQILHTIYSNKISNCINVFIFERNDNFHFFIMDEFGVLDYKEKKRNDATFYMTVLYNFLNNMITWIKNNNKNNILNKTEKPLIFFKIIKNQTSFKVTKLNDEFYKHLGKVAEKQRKAAVQLDVLENGKKNYIFDVTGTIFESSKYGAEIFKKVTFAIAGLRKNPTLYPLFITEIEPIGILKQKIHNLQISDFMIYKNYIENQLNYHLFNTDWTKIKNET